MASADVAYPACALEELRRRGLVVVMRAGLGVGQEAAVVDAAGDDRDAALDAFGQQLLEGDLVQKGVAARQQEAVEVAFTGEACKHLRLVHARAHSADRAIGAQTIERFISAPDGLVVVVVGVVDVQDVDAVEAQPREALLEGPHDSVVAEIEHRVDRGWALPGLAGLGWRVRAQKPADLARRREFVATLLSEYLAHSRLGQPMAV